VQQEVGKLANAHQFEPPPIPQFVTSLASDLNFLHPHGAAHNGCRHTVRPVADIASTLLATAVAS
jgi:hypothetical protein